METKDILNNFFKSAFSVDCVVFGVDENDLKILLINRGAEPYKGMWALPGDLVNPDEDLDTAARRVLKDLTGVQDVYLEQVETFGRVDRHPLGRVITIAYYALVKITDYKLDPSSWAEDAEWHSVEQIRELAFDHEEILKSCQSRLRQKLKSEPLAFNLLPEKFTLTELQSVYEVVFGEELDKRNFRKKIMTMGFVKDLNELQEGVAHRPAKLYGFDKNGYETLEKNVLF